MTMQRVFDIFFSLIGIALLSPLLLPISMVLLFTGEGEVFFRQKRVGRNGSIFHIWKFATMLKNSPDIGPGTITLKDDPRILPMGKFLRKSKMNELPQLLNVLFGEMSVIGPRPLTQETLAAYSEKNKSEILGTLPGLSGIGSVVFRNEESLLVEEATSLFVYMNEIGPYKEKIEVWYVQHQTIATYFSMIFLTLWAVIFPKSALVWQRRTNLLLRLGHPLGCIPA